MQWGMKLSFVKIYTRKQKIKFRLEMRSDEKVLEIFSKKSVKKFH